MLKQLKLIFGLLAIALLALAAARAASSADLEPVRKIVVFGPQVPVAERVKAAEAAGGEIVRRLDMINAVVVEAHPGIMRIAEGRLRQNPAVLRVDADPRINWLLAAAPARPESFLPEAGKAIAPFRSSRLAAQDAPAGQETPWGISRVNAASAWPTTRGAGVKIAVIDTGIDREHPDLKANVAGGWNATDKAKADDFTDDNGHGTHCSGTIAALDDDTGVVGVAPKASLYGVKVLDADGSGTFDDVIAGMQWAVEHRMQVASMSLGASKGNESLKAAVEAMAKAGVVLIAAAGNSGAAVGYPAAYPGAIAVAALDPAEKVAYFSSRGPSVALIAPGVDVKSTYMGGAFDTLSGTSMATPHVSGLAALAIAVKKLSGVDAVRAALVNASQPLKGVPAEQQGAGVPDAAALVR